MYIVYIAILISNKPNKIKQINISPKLSTIDRLQSETEVRRRVYIEVPRLRFGLRVLHR